MTRHAGLLSQPVPACTPSAAQPAQPCASAGLPGTRTVAAQRLGPGERCKGERWHSCSRPLGERLGKGQVTGASLQCWGKPGNHLQTPSEIICHASGHLEPSTSIPPRRCVADGTAQVLLAAGGLSQQGMLLALQGALSQTWLPGTPWLQGTREAHRSSQARVSAGGQDRNQICRARALAGATQQPLSHVGTSCPSEQPCTISTPSKGGTSTMKPWLSHPSFPTHAGSRRYRAWQHHFPCVWNWFCCLC